MTTPTAIRTELADALRDILADVRALRWHVESLAIRAIVRQELAAKDAEDDSAPSGTHSTH